MARRDNLIKSKSIYTIRRKHATTNGGTIYEHDHITIIPNDGIYDDEMPLFSESNFKFRIRRGVDGQKRHVRDGWINSDGGSEVWTKLNLPKTEKSSEGKIELKPNYTSLKDFAFYGSATELVHATVNDIIDKFPGSICYYDTPISGKVGAYTYYLVSNETDIDCWSDASSISGDTENPLKVLSIGYDNYVNGAGLDIDKPEIKIIGECIDSFIGTVKIAGVTLYIKNCADGKKRLYSRENGRGVIIRPKKDVIESFWDKANDFEKVLLNRNSTPIYRAVFDTPFFTNTGYYYNNEAYVWPTVSDGRTPDMTTSAYEGYINRLIKLAEFYDEYESDNLWRMNTHESIKNLDWTFMRKTEEGIDDLSDIDSSRIEAAIRMYGRQFDDIKRSADNIKYVNSISYNEQNNIPDYFLTDCAELDGWEAYNVGPTGATGPAKVYYSGSSQMNYTASEANINFIRRLCLNSDYIQSMKGTVRGIETILGLFGMVKKGDVNCSGIPVTQYDYEINEFIYVAQKFPDYNQLSQWRAYAEYVNYGENDNYMAGYPVINVTPENGGSDYLIPWYSDKEEYAQPLYFQEKGGWGRKTSKDINVSIAPSVSRLEGYPIYEETEPYMKYASSIQVMLDFSNDEVEEGDVCYVTDISEMYNGMGYKDSTGKGSDYSHYFYLNKKALSHYLGDPESELYNCDGWINIRKSEYEGSSTYYGKKVLYLESLRADYKGNNPHTGKGNYDNGSSYIERFNSVFIKAVEDGVFDKLKDSDIAEEKAAYEGLCKTGFDLKKVNDNVKCYYFFDGTDSRLQSIGTKDNIVTGKYGNFKSNEGLASYDESAALSIVNVKNIEITFRTRGSLPYKKYIEDVVIKYLEQMIPSTAILGYKFDDEVYSAVPYDIYDASALFRRFVAHMAYTANDNLANYYNEDEETFEKK